MDSLISRQAAIDALGEAPKYKQKIIKTYEEGRNDQWFDDVARLSVVPSAQPERKKGKWVGYDGDWLKTMCKCSECGAMIDINEKYRNFFCYHCGARMDGEQDE